MRPILLPLLLLALSPVVSPLRADTAATPTEQGVALFKKRHYAEARPLLAAAVAANPRDAEARAYLGMLFNNFDQDANQAIAHLEEAVRLDPKQARFHAMLAGAYGSKAGSVVFFRKMGWADKAKAELERAVALDPKEPEFHFGLMQYYLMVPSIAGGGVDKARAEAAVIAGLDPYRGLLAEGGIAEKEKELPKAEALYRKAIALAPGKLPAYNSLGYVLLRLKRVPEAVEIFRKAVAADPNDPNAHDSLAEALLAAGQSEASLAEYRQALELDPWFSASYPSLAEGYLRAKDLPKARQAYEKYLELAPHGSQAEEARKKVVELKKKGA